MQVGTYIAPVDMNNIRVRIDQLEIKIESMVQTADFLGNEDAVKLAIDEIKKKKETFAEMCL
jgi:CO dehydrogenase/acetyl-CoA synthase delta subunit